MNVALVICLAYRSLSSIDQKILITLPPPHPPIFDHRKGCLKRTEFYQIEHLEILLPVGKKTLMIFVANLEMLKSVKLSFFRHSVLHWRFSGCLLSLVHHFFVFLCFCLSFSFYPIVVVLFDDCVVHSEAF